MTLLIKNIHKMPLFVAQVNFISSYFKTYWLDTVQPALYNVMGDIQRMSAGTAKFAHRKWRNMGRKGTNEFWQTLQPTCRIGSIIKEEYEGFFPTAAKS